MSQPTITAGSLYAELLRAREGGESLEQLQIRAHAIEKQIAVQTQGAVVEVKLQMLGHASENTSCDHAHYSFEKHGRYCACGSIMVDFGD